MKTPLTGREKIIFNVHSIDEWEHYSYIIHQVLPMSMKHEPEARLEEGVTMKPIADKRRRQDRPQVGHARPVQDPLRGGAQRNTGAHGAEARQHQEKLGTILAPALSTFNSRFH